MPVFSLISSLWLGAFVGMADWSSSFRSDLVGSPSHRRNTGCYKRWFGFALWCCTGDGVCTFANPSTKNPWEGCSASVLLGLNPVDVIRLLTAVYKNSNSRFQVMELFVDYFEAENWTCYLKHLDFQPERSQGVTPYDLGSFRPGGATFLLQLFEDAEFVRRRGRWVSAKVLEVYLQEISTATFQSRISDYCPQTNRRSFARLSADPW